MSATALTGIPDTYLTFGRALNPRVSLTVGYATTSSTTGFEFSPRFSATTLISSTFGSSGMAGKGMPAKLRLFLVVLEAFSS